MRKLTFCLPWGLCPIFLATATQCIAAGNIIKVQFHRTKCLLAQDVIPACFWQESIGRGLDARSPPKDCGDKLRGHDG
jgi:hypothetical protein